MAKKPRKRRQTRLVKYQVFVSHATADKWIAKALCDKIESVNATTFRDDRDIDGGDDIPEKIRLAIRRSNEIVILFTPESVDRAWVLLEAGAAWGRSAKMRLVAVLCHVDVDSIPDLIKSKKAIPINDFDNYLKELSARVRKHRL